MNELIFYIIATVVMALIIGFILGCRYKGSK